MNCMSFYVLADIIILFCFCQVCETRSVETFISEGVWAMRHHSCLLKVINPFYKRGRSKAFWVETHNDVSEAILANNFSLTHLRTNTIAEGTNRKSNSGHTHHFFISFYRRQIWKSYLRLLRDHFTRLKISPDQSYYFCITPPNIETVCWIHLSWILTAT